MAHVKWSETNLGLVTGKVISLLEGGYDTSPTLGLAKCVDVRNRELLVSTDLCLEKYT
jgi:hypothetical protein